MLKRLLIAGLIASFAAVWAGSAVGYEILLDIDLDDDPTTLNTFTLETTVTVKIVLSPSEPGELISEITFGLGGTCWECDGVFDYGTAFDLHPPDFGDWTDHPDLTGSWTSAVCSLCCANPPGYHYVYMASAVGGGLVLDEPVFIATFSAWRDDPMWGWCPVPPSNLAAFFETGPGGFWNFIQIGGEAPLPAITTTWGRIKSFYE
jgi:hypothetical protein